MDRRTLFQGFLAFLALIAFAELLFSNLLTLLTSLEATAASFGISPGAERIRLVILMLLDAVAGGGAVFALVMLRREDPVRFSQGLLVTAIGFVGYAIYQIASAWLQLAPAVRVPVTGAAIIYALFGLGAFFGGRAVWRADESRFAT